MTSTRTPEVQIIETEDQTQTSLVLRLYFFNFPRRWISLQAKSYICNAYALRIFSSLCHPLQYGWLSLHMVFSMSHLI